jgi:hypothetical protein
MTQPSEYVDRLRAIVDELVEDLRSQLPEDIWETFKRPRSEYPVFSRGVPSDPKLDEYAGALHELDDAIDRLERSFKARGEIN